MSRPEPHGDTQTREVSLNAEDQVAIDMYRLAAAKIETLIGDMESIVNELRREVKRVTDQ